MAQLPCNGIQGILCGAAQEIQALRQPEKIGGNANAQSRHMAACPLELRVRRFSTKNILI
jgi:hypothetical protein